MKVLVWSTYIHTLLVYIGNFIIAIIPPAPKHKSLMHFLKHVIVDLIQ